MADEEDDYMSDAFLSKMYVLIAIGCLYVM